MICKLQKLQCKFSLVKSVALFKLRVLNNSPRFSFVHDVNKIVQLLQFVTSEISKMDD